MKYLKKLWELCGDEDFTLKVMLATATLFTINTITTLDSPPMLNALIIGLNLLLGLLYLFRD